jgi:hypothetical protein
VRTNSALSRQVVRLRDAGKSWRQVKAEIEAEISSRAPSR